MAEFYDDELSPHGYERLAAAIGELTIEDLEIFEPDITGEA